MSSTSRRTGAALAALTLTALLTGCGSAPAAPAAPAAAVAIAPVAAVRATTPPRTTAPPRTTRPPRTTTPRTTTPRATTPPRTTTPRTTTPRTTTPQTTTPQTTTPAAGSVAEQVLVLVNDARGGAGCPAVRLEDRLTRAALDHSTDMARNDYFSHTGRDGRSFVDRIRAQGYPAPRSENIAAGQRTPADVMRSWLDSPGHRRNILDCTATEMGLGLAEGGSYGRYWTQVFGTG